MMSLSNIGIRTSGNFSSTASLLPDDKPSNPDIPDQLNTNPDKLNPHLLNNNLHSIPKPLPDIQRSLATTLQMASAAGDDRSLISHGSDRKYWYSIGDGYRLLLAIRKNNLTYKNEAKTGEEYSAYRENDQHIFITDPYHINNFDNSLEDDIKKITGSHEITALNKKWAHLPKVIIIPVLTGCHWRCLRIKMDYTHRKITILFDDPYGKHRFEKEIKSSLKESISNHVGHLIACVAQQRNDPNFQPSQIVFKDQDKEINQQGVGNGYDCGPIVFCNIADYANTHKKTKDLCQGKGLRITKAADASHEELMITVRTAHIREYTKIAGIRLDETRLTAIKSLMQEETQAKLDNMRKRSDIEEALHLQISHLPPESINMIFNAMELGLSIQEAYDGIKAEHYNKTNSASMVAMSRISFLPSSTSSTGHPNRSFPVSDLKSSITPSSTASVESRLAIHPDHRNLQGLSLSLPDMKQLLEEVQHNKLIGHITWGKLPSGKKAKKLRDRIEQAIIENNKIYQRYPTDFIYGVLSKHSYENAYENADEKNAYENAKVGKTVTFKEAAYHHYNLHVAQWTIHSVHDLSELGGYYGAVYENKQTRQLVLAHRGTPPSLTPVLQGESAIKEDIKGVIGGEIVNQHYAAYKVTKKVAEYAKKHHYHFSITGHSLGAWLAEISVYFSEFEFNMSAKAVTFDSPGSITMNIFNPNIENPENERNIKNLDITTYLSDPNFINTCNQHVGRVYRLYPEYEKLYKQKTSAKVLKKAGQFAGVKLEGLWSISGHALAPLLATFNPLSGKPHKVDLMSSWPDIKYTPNDKLSNLVGNAIGALVLVLKQPTIKNLLTKKANDIINKTRYRTTIGNVVNLLVDIPLAILKKRIDLSQYATCWKILSKSDISQEEEVLLRDKFSLTYEGSYKTSIISPSTCQLIADHIGSADWYLKKLADCPPEKIIQDFGQNSLITKQLSALRALYKIKPEKRCEQIKATNNTSIEEIRERLLRLISVTGDEISTFLETHQQILFRSHSNLSLTSYIPPSLGERYVLRTEDINQIDQRLVAHPYMIISGEPGWGKTTLAIEYGHRQRIYPVVIQINADSKEKIDSGYRRIALALNINTEQQDAETVIVLINSRISNQKKKVLLIFDNVNAYDHIKPYLDYLPSNAKALITTRDHSLIVDAPFIKAKPFTYEEAKQYIEDSPIKDKIQPGSQEIQNLFKHYAKDTDYIAPYYLKRAIAIIKEMRTGNITTYLRNVEKLQDNQGELLLLIQQLTEKSKLAWPMLQYAAFLDPDAIDIQIFTQLFGIDETELEEVIKVLESLSAMYVVWKDGQAMLSLHRLTQGIVRKLIENPAKQIDSMTQTDILLELTKSLNSLCPNINENPKNWPQAKKLISHIELVLTKLPDTLNNSQIAQLWTKSGGYARNILGTYKQAFNHYQKSLEMQQKLYPDQLQDGIAQSLNDVGYAYINLGGVGNTEKGMTLLKQALDMWQALYPDQAHYGVAHSLNYLGLAYQNLGGIENSKKSLALHEQALTMQKVLYADQPHPDVAVSLTYVAIAYQSLGGIENHRKGLALHEQTLAMQKVLHADQPHPDVAASLNNLGNAYQSLGGIENHKKGLALHEQALAMQKVLHADQPHPDVAAILSNVGIAYQSLGGVENSKKGLALQEEALAMDKILHGDQPHPDVASSLNNVGSAYKNLGGVENSRKGLALQEAALAMQRVLHSDQPHPDVASSLNNVGSAYKNLGGVDNSRKGLALQEEALAMRKILYGDQPDSSVASSLNNVGSAYKNLGGIENSRKGLALQEEALAMQRVLHADQPHPDLATALNNLGTAYESLGGVENSRKGLALQKEALTMQKILHGDQPHPDVASSLNNVGNAYEKLGGVENSKKGLDLQEQSLAMRQTLSENQPHPEIAQSLYDIGYAYVALGDSTKGFALIVQSSEMKKKIGFPK